MRLWDMEAGVELAQLREQRGAVCAVAFSPDGQRIASASREDGTVRSWPAYRSRDDLAAAFGAKVPRCLSPAQKLIHGLAAPGTEDAWNTRQPAPPCW